VAGGPGFAFQGVDGRGLPCLGRLLLKDDSRIRANAHSCDEAALTLVPPFLGYPPPGGYLGRKSNDCNKIAGIDYAKFVQPLDLLLKSCQQTTYWQRRVFEAEKAPAVLPGLFLIFSSIIED
jgi:hypothetical protein